MNLEKKAGLCPCHVSWMVRGEPVSVLPSTGGGPFPFEDVQTLPSASKRGYCVQSGGLRGSAQPSGPPLARRLLPGITKAPGSRFRT